jgi:FemAB-related protein (PEP-CTERM system-associated)
MRPGVRRLSPDEAAIWPEGLASAAGFVGADSWMKFVERIYRYRAYRLAARVGDETTGLLALTHVKHPIFGDYLTTAPFGSYGGFAFSSVESRNVLLEEARSLADELGVQYVNVRFDAGEADPPAGWVQHPIYATYCADLSAGPEALLATYGPDHRNHIRKSLKKAFTLKFGRLDLLEDAYEALARSMHELGSPYHARKYLDTMARTLGDSLEFAVLYGPQRQLAGAGVFIFQGATVTNLHANILRAFRPDYAGEFLYWSVITHWHEKGLRVFDMGRSLIGSGNEVFKSKWKPQKRPLAYWYALRGGRVLPELNQKNPRFRLAIWAWRHLPEFVVRPVGPYLIKGLA